MFFDDLIEISRIAKENGASVFAISETAGASGKRDALIKNAILLEPVEKNVITIDQVREALQRVNLKQTDDQYILIWPADALGDEAANAILKNLEEPGDKVHFILITNSPSKLLPTVLSRSAIYFYRDGAGLDLRIHADEKDKMLAKRLIAASGTDLVMLAEEIAKHKNNVRKYALEVMGLAIEMLYKSFFITGKDMFVKKLPKFLKAYENISKNGNIKLHIVADLC